MVRPRLAFAVASVFALLLAQSALAGINFVGAELTNASPDAEYMATGDFNSDGRTDVVVVSPGSKEVTLYLAADGPSRFAPARVRQVGKRLRRPAVGDLNDDGRLDVAVPDQTEQAVWVLLGDGNGNFLTPQRVGVPVADMFTGFAAAVSILAALRHRDATGEGQYVEVSLFETMMSLIQAPNSSWLNTGRLVPRSGNDSPVAVPYGVFEGSDARFVIGVLNDREFVRLAAALGHPEWSEDPRFKRARDRVERAPGRSGGRTLLPSR